MDILAFVSSCTSDSGMISNAQAIVDILEMSKEVGAKAYPFIAGAGFLIGFAKAI